MELLVLILNREEHLDDVLSAFVEVGITGATVIDSVGMGRILVQDVPVFAGLKQMLEGSKPYNKTILAVVKGREQIDELIGVVEEIVGPLDEPGKGLLFTVPINIAKGFTEEF